MEFKSQTLNIRRNGAVYYITFPSFEENRTGAAFIFYAPRRRQPGKSGSHESWLFSGRPAGKRYGKLSPHQLCLRYLLQRYGIFGSGSWRPHCIGGSARPRRRDLTEVDGLVTDKPQVCLVTFYADCVPLFFLDPVKKAIGLAHAGWRGTVLEIGRKMVLRMNREFGSRPEDILAGIGPSIGPCCFEVGPEVKAQFVNAFPAWQAEIIRPAQDPEKSYIDLWRTNELILRRAGIREEHITVTDLCTKCHSEYFHSHRRMGNDRGTQAAFLELI